MTQSIHCTDSDATENFGERLGQNLQGREVIELISDLGGGKTTLTRGIARGAGSSDVVGSPTFTISKVYRAVNCDIYHFDFYRLNEAGLMAHELHDVLNDPHSVVVVEWGDVVQHVLPTQRLTVRINKTADDARELICSYPAELEYLLI
jgi:tRNA threonylcarbamoyladenosine biosynthesis protein TsaE